LKKHIQDKLAQCENKFSSTQRNIDEIQTRLNFTDATEDVLKDNFKRSEQKLTSIDEQIENLKKKEDQEGRLPDLRAKMSEFENKIANEKSSKLNVENNQSSNSAELKKISIEYDAIVEKVNGQDKSIKELETQQTTIEQTLKPYNENLEKLKKIDVNIEDLSEDLDKAKSQIDDSKTNVAEFQFKKRELMEESMSATSSPTDEQTDTSKNDKEALRDQRKEVRTQIKDLDAKIKEIKENTTEDNIESTRDEVNNIRAQRDSFHKQIEEINSQIDAVKESGGTQTSSSADTTSSMKIAQAIGELDIKILQMTKNIQQADLDIEKKEAELNDLKKGKTDLILEIEKQKSIIAPIEDTKKKIAALNQEKTSTKRSLDDKGNQKQTLAKKVQESEEGTKSILDTIESTQKELTQVKNEIGSIESSIASHRKQLDELMGSKGKTLAEHNRLKSEMDSMIQNTAKDREMVESEKLAAENTNKEMEKTKKQLSEAMSILTGKTGSLENLKLELNSSEAEVNDFIDRINTLDLDLKSADAAILGIESNIEPKLNRLKYVDFAIKMLTERLAGKKINSQMDSLKTALEELEKEKQLHLGISLLRTRRLQNQSLFLIKSPGGTSFRYQVSHRLFEGC